MFHFMFDKDSIDARHISDEDLKWCKRVIRYGKDTENYNTVIKMFELWFPEYLV